MKGNKNKLHIRKTRSRQGLFQEFNSSRRNGILMSLPLLFFVFSDDENAMKDP